MERSYEMLPFGEIQLIDETDLEVGDLIELYKELIRIIEKDIENLASTRFGFTPWSLLTALGAVGLILFGVGNGIFEADPTLVGRAYLFGYFALQEVYILVSATDFDNPVKPKRVYFPRERLAFYPPLIFRWVLFVVAIVISLRVWEWNGSAVFAIIGSLIVALTYILMTLPLLLNPLTGNNPRFGKAGPVVIAILNVGYACLIISSFLFLPWPVQLTAASFAIGGLLALMVVLAELYIVTASPNPIVKRLSNLRDDIIFRRKSINDALLELRRIREGSTFFEAVAAEIEKVSAKTNEKFQTFGAAKRLLESIEALLKDTDIDGDKLKHRLDEIAPFEQAYLVTKANVIRLKNDIDDAMNQLNEKAQKVVAASGDLDSPELFDSYFREAHRRLNSDLAELFARESEIGNEIIRLKSLL